MGKLDSSNWNLHDKRSSRPKRIRVRHLTLIDIPLSPRHCPYQSPCLIGCNRSFLELSLTKKIGDTHTHIRTYRHDQMRADIGSPACLQTPHNQNIWNVHWSAYKTLCFGNFLTPFDIKRIVSRRNLDTKESNFYNASIR